MWSVLPTWAYPPSDPLHSPYYTVNMGFCQLLIFSLDRLNIWVYNGLSPSGLIYSIYTCRQLPPQLSCGGFFMGYIKVGKTSCDPFSTNQKKIKIWHLCIQECTPPLVTLATPRKWGKLAIKLIVKLMTSLCDCLFYQENPQILYIKNTSINCLYVSSFKPFLYLHIYHVLFFFSI